MFNIQAKDITFDHSPDILPLLHNNPKHALYIEILTDKYQLSQFEIVVLLAQRVSELKGGDHPRIACKEDTPDQIIAYIEFLIGQIQSSELKRNCSESANEHATTKHSQFYNKQDDEYEKSVTSSNIETHDLSALFDGNPND